MMCGVFNLAFCHVLFWSWNWIDIFDVFLRERSRDETFVVIRDRKVSPNSLVLHNLNCVSYSAAPNEFIYIYSICENWALFLFVCDVYHCSFNKLQCMFEFLKNTFGTA